MAGSDSSPPPSHKSKRSGRIITATKRKLQAPIDAFIKTVKPTKKARTTAVDSSSKEPSTCASSPLLPTSPDVLPTPPPPARCASQPTVIDLEDDSDESSNGDVLAMDSDVIMVDASPEPSTSAGKSTRSKGKDKDTSDSNGPRISVTDDMRKKWRALIYGFFKPEPLTNPVNSCACLSFICAADICSRPTCLVRHYADKRAIDGSTGNLHTHARKCFGDEADEAASNHKNADKVRKISLTNGGVLTAQAITVAFERKGKGKLTYSTRAHTEAESRAETVRWVAESMRPIAVVKDRGYNSLMKTGCPHHYIPSPSTVLRDIKLVFARIRNRVAKTLQEHEGSLHFATDCWTLPNHRAYQCC